MSSSPAVLRWAVHTRGLNRAIALPDDPNKKPVVRADGKRDPPRLGYARWPDADARAYVPAGLARCVVAWGDTELGPLAEWEQFCRAEWLFKPRESLARDGGVEVARILSAWDVCACDRIDLAAPAVWVVEHWWSDTGVRLDGAEVVARFRAAREATNESARPPDAISVCKPSRANQ